MIIEDERDRGVASTMMVTMRVVIWDGEEGGAGPIRELFCGCFRAWLGSGEWSAALFVAMPSSVAVT